ncbi:hypothetical protein [Kordiimonas sp. SCSIO 12610]|uniref:hypothetical protein n=1 Tax=Kordiimonas sp. SCSIO 12610 TaxID=2829597 RepID=UPI00210B23C5|nr:hypothetical protein [Kordiimonas sp. SCSIO 12610]UTW56102.1 hypothetical protein KFF44_04190 [Kordiimonas sp. SCSIO 12610]
MPENLWPDSIDARRATIFYFFAKEPSLEMLTANQLANIKISGLLGIVPGAGNDQNQAAAKSAAQNIYYAINRTQEFSFEDGQNEDSVIESLATFISDEESTISGFAHEIDKLIKFEDEI